MHTLASMFTTQRVEHMPVVPLFNEFNVSSNSARYDLYEVPLIMDQRMEGGQIRPFQNSQPPNRYYDLFTQTQFKRIE